LAAPASAQKTEWSLGTSEYTTGFNCTSLIFPPARLEQQTFASRRPAAAIPSC
jgi:hypothetical protein